MELYAPEALSSNNYTRWFNTFWTDNVQLRVLSALPFQQKVVSPEALRAAKKTLSSFTIVLDMACLNSSLRKLAALLGLREGSWSKCRKDKRWLASKERINDTKMYEYIERKNKFDIELYNHGKTLALLNCDSKQGDDDDIGRKKRKENNGSNMQKQKQDKDDFDGLVDMELPLDERASACSIASK